MKKKFKITTLGCRTNQYESQAYRSQLEALGYVEAQADDEADLCIVNTCTVTESADQDSKAQIRRLARRNPHAKVVVTGCLIEHYPQILDDIPEIALVVPNKEKETLLARLFPDAEELPEFKIDHFAAHTRAFVKVQDGCDSYCTYCIIPYVRGRSRSRTVQEIVKEVEGLVQNGYNEVVLTGINIGDFDGAEEPPVHLSTLVRAVDKIPGLQRLRLSSIDPDEVDEDLASAVLEGKTTCHSMHLVLQAGSNVMLKKMNRKYTRQIFLTTVDTLLRADPDFTFTTDIIVGFPGETEKDFAETLEVMEEVQFAKVHMFPYSERPKTRAALYPNKVPPDIIRHRKQELLHASERVAYKLRDRFVGRCMTVLTEQRDVERPHEIFGHTANFLGVWVQSAECDSNQMITVELTANTPQGLVGRLI